MHTTVQSFAGQTVSLSPTSCHQSYKCVTKCLANATEKCANIMHPGWKIYGETFFQTRTGVWPLWQGEQHWKVPSRVSGFPTLQCLSSGNSRLLLGPLIRDTSATHLVIFSQQHILQMDILESAVDTGDPHHILCALPTGFGKTMPMLLLGHLLPPGAGCKISDPFALHNVLSRVHYDDRGPPHPN